MRLENEKFEMYLVSGYGGTLELRCMNSKRLGFVSCAPAT